VILWPYLDYQGVSDEGLFRYFSEVIERTRDDRYVLDQTIIALPCGAAVLERGMTVSSRLRIYLYHIPPVAQVGISLKLVERLLKAYPSGVIAGIKVRPPLPTVCWMIVIPNVGRRVVAGFIWGLGQYGGPDQELWGPVLQRLCRSVGACPAPSRASTLMFPCVGPGPRRQ
jgi:hypothetical protein